MEPTPKMETTHPNKEQLYDIIRFYRDNRPYKIIKCNVTLEEAQTHCRKETTRGDGWFDGYGKAGHWT